MNEQMTKLYSILSNKEEAFNVNGQIPVWVDTHQHPIAEVFENYEYPVTTWPVLINREMANELNELCVKMPGWLQAIPALYFNNDVKKIAGFYFDGDEVQAQFALMCHDKKAKVGCRLDLTYTPNGFKVLEVNMGTSIGGWQIQSFEPIIRQYHPELANNISSGGYTVIDTQRMYTKFLVDQVLATLGNHLDTVNIFINLADLENDPVFQKKSEQFFNNLITEELARRGLKGGAFTGDISKITLNNGLLELDKRPIHGVIIFGATPAANNPEIFRAFIMDKVYFPDHTGLVLLGDKRNLGILLELALAGKFSPDDNELIMKHIPWTSSFYDKTVEYDGLDYQLPELLAAYKDQFVLKHTRGFQGKDVFVGRFTGMEEWNAALQLALNDKRFIAQEFCDSINFMAPNRNNNWTPHKLIWGAFGFGDYYGGVWVRMSEVASGQGVINSATGAVEAIVYEYSR
ncbi:MAG: hypothetical protein JNM68_07665 [Dinghuibacter sp.]|nr:hypothetical protein [Dinghuibacter sp.]